jgi:pyruvyl transferase EpsO
VTGRFALLASLADAIGDALRPLIDPGRPVALLDFPSYANVGDSAIWLGALAALDRLGVSRPAYTCDWATYHRGLLAARVGSGTILLSGGGNLGDLWERHQRFRETVIRDFPGNPVVQLPQSIHFRDPGALARARAVFDGHSRLSLLLRDRASLDLARNAFRASAGLCPDLAFALGPLSRPVPPSLPVCWLARDDQERRHPPSDAVPAPARRDWATEPAGIRQGLTRRLSRWLTTRPGHRPLRALVSATYRPLARQRVRRGARLLSEGRVVVTDRLHGHVLALLLGIPHVLLDNSYGKVRGCFDTWTAGAPQVGWAGSADEAWDLANRMAGAPSCS